MTVTMVNKETGTIIYGVRLDFIYKWEKLGFNVKKYDSNKVSVFR